MNIESRHPRWMPIFLAILCMPCLATEGAWTWLSPLPQGDNLRDVHFADAQTGYATGEAGAIVKTGDGGTTWAPVHTDKDRSYTLVHFPTPDTGFVAGIGAGRFRMDKTFDGGRTWIRIAVDTQYYLQDIRFLDGSAGFVLAHELSGASAYMARILKTVDGGKSWQIAFSASTSFVLNSIRFTSRMVGYAVGDSGIILKTSDGGSTWTRRNSGTSHVLNGLDFPSQDTGFAVTGRGSVLRTVDSGANWTRYVIRESYPYFQNLSMVNSRIGYFGGYQDSLWKTTDGGTTWTSVVNSWSWKGGRIHFVAPDTGFVIGLGGYIGKTMNGGKTWTAYSEIAPKGILYHVQFADNRVGYMKGTYDAGMWRSVDAGKSWRRLPGQNASSLGEFRFLDGLRGIAIIDSKRLMKTVDGGQTWTGAEYDSAFHTRIGEEYFQFLQTPDARTAFAVTNKGSVARSSDGWQTWKFVSPDSVLARNFRIFDAQFPTPEVGYLAGEFGAFYKTMDGGETWSWKKVHLDSGTYLQNTISDIHFTDGRTGFLLGKAGSILKTSDGGESWKAVPLGLATGMVRLDFPNADTGFAMGHQGRAARTVDAGESWTLIHTGTNIFVQTMSFPTGTWGCALGNYSALLQWGDPGPVGIAPNKVRRKSAGIRFDRLRNHDLTGRKLRKKKL